MAKIQLLVGSVNGRAEQTAQVVAMVLQKQSHQVELNGAPTPADLMRDPDELILICCATTGQGELPASMYPLFYALDQQAVSLNGRAYGVIALGDSGYSQFAQAGLMLENALYQCGAKRIGEICFLDARREANQPVAAAVWASDWINQAGHR